MARQIVFLLSLLLICAGCQSRALDSSKSPDGRFEIEVSSTEFLSKDSTVFVKILGRTVGNTKVDFMPALSQTAWTADSRVVGVVVFDKLGSDFEFAYDAVSGREVDFSQARLAVGQALLARYHKEAAGDEDALADPIGWVSKQRRDGRIPSDW